MTEYIPVQIVQRTTNGYIVQDSTGRQAWVGERYLHNNGTVGKALFERKATEKIARDKARAEDPNREFLEGYHPIDSKKESGDGVAVMASWTGSHGQGGRHLVWFPNSMIKDNKVPGLLIRRKAEEVRGKLANLAFIPVNEIEIEIAGFKF
jgi:hypothetical protein